MADYFIHYKLWDILFDYCAYVHTAHRLQCYQSFEGSFILHIFASVASLSFWGEIINIDFKVNVGTDTEGGFPHISQFVDYLSDPLKHLSWNFCQLYWTWEFFCDIRKQFLLFLTCPIHHLIYCMEISFWSEYIEDFICCQRWIIDGVMGISSSVWSEELLESPDN